MHYPFAKLYKTKKATTVRVALICDNETSVFYMDDILS